MGLLAVARGGSRRTDDAQRRAGHAEQARTRIDRGKNPTSRGRQIAALFDLKTDALEAALDRAFARLRAALEAEAEAKDRVAFLDPAEKPV
jgi:hypothetical protein